MQTPASLNRLSHAEKDELILLMQARLQEFGALQKQLQATVAQLQLRGKKNSRNSSKPPSTDGLNKPDKPAPKSLREGGLRPTGGQKGHPGRTLSQVADPDQVVTHGPPAQCPGCQRSLDASQVVQTRQVFDLPVLRHEVTEHRVLRAVCACGQVHTGQFPDGVRAQVQYGPGAQAVMVHLNQNHAVSLKRSAELMGELFGLPVSQASVLSANAGAAAVLEPTVHAIGQGLVASAVVGADETGVRVAKKLHWLHVLATGTLTWLGCHAKRGGEAFESLALLGQFRGVLVHDGWLPYKALECVHALCNAHHLRELTYLFEEQGQAWAGDMMALLRHANHLDNTQCAYGQTPRYESQSYLGEVRELRDLFEAILSDGDANNPVVAGTGKRGRPRQSKATNLLTRLREYADDVWRFMSEPGVPFTNNVAEQAVRMPKVKQKVSGCFRSQDGADIYCTIRSYCATMHKQGANIFESLVGAFQGHAPQPNFG